jgi:hypothetical protein
MQLYLNQIKSKGYTFPVKILEEDEAKGFYDEYLYLSKKIKSERLKFEHKFKSHLIFKRVNDIICNPKIINIAKSILGEDILCWNSIIFYKPANSKKFVGWHEDKTYWKLHNNKVITFSIAITNSNTENGCLKILKNRKIVKYKTSDVKNNMLARGQDAIIDQNDEFENIILKPGECSIFEQDVIHGSGPNSSNQDRLLLAIRYISTDNKTEGNHKTAKLVNGEDKFNYYEKEPNTLDNFETKNLKFHNKIMGNQAKIFAKFKLRYFFLKPFALIIKISFIRGLYYKFFKD